MFSPKIEQLVISRNILQGQSQRVDILKRLIVDGFNFKNLKLLSLSTVVSEQSMFILLDKCPFPALEVVKLNNKFLRTSVRRVKAHCKLARLKKLNLKGCVIKLESDPLFPK